MTSMGESPRHKKYHTVIIQLPNDLYEKLTELKNKYGLSYSLLITIILNEKLSKVNIDDLILELKEKGDKKSEH